METLGKTLKSARENVSLTLRDVENSTGISTAYLSQLENEKIKKPSANVLYKLANIYKVKLNVLLSAAGIIKPKDHDHEDDDKSFLETQVAFYKDELSEHEQQQVVEFIKFLRFTNGNKNGTSQQG